MLIVLDVVILHKPIHASHIVGLNYRYFNIYHVHLADIQQGLLLEKESAPSVCVFLCAINIYSVNLVSNFYTCR